MTGSLKTGKSNETERSKRTTTQASPKQGKGNEEQHTNHHTSSEERNSTLVGNGEDDSDIRDIEYDEPGQTTGRAQTTGSIANPVSKIRLHRLSASVSTTITREDWSSSDDEEVTSVAVPIDSNALPTVGSSDIPHSPPLTFGQTTSPVAYPEESVAASLVATAENPPLVPHGSIKTTSAASNMMEAEVNPISKRTSSTTQASALQDPVPRAHAPQVSQTPLAGGSDVLQGQQNPQMLRDARLYDLPQAQSSSPLVQLQQEHPLPLPQPLPSNDGHLPWFNNMQAPRQSAQVSTPLEKLSLLENAIRLGGENTLDILRFTFLKHAAATQDLEALLMHQLYMLSSYGPDVLARDLAYDSQHFAGVSKLSYVFGDDDRLTPNMRKAAMDFPDPCSSLLRPERRNFIEQMKDSLKALGSQWHTAQATYYSRSYPLSPKEIETMFKLSSPALQKAVFTSLVEELRGWRSAQHKQGMLNRFDLMQIHAAGFYPSVELKAWRKSVVAACGPGLMPPSLQRQQQQPPSQTPARYNFGGQEYTMPAQVRSMGQIQAGRTQSPMQVRQYAAAVVSGNVQVPIHPPLQSPGKRHPLLPAANAKPMALAVHPQYDRIALHQVQLWTPLAYIVDGQGQPAPSLRLHQVVRHLVAKPIRLSAEERYTEVQFEVKDVEIGNKLAWFPSKFSKVGQGHHASREGSLRWRFRCVSRKHSKDPIDEAEFCAISTTWPEYLVVTCNDKDVVELRRKQHYGKHLPAEITEAVREGINTLAISYDEAPNEIAGKELWIAVELVELVEREKLRGEVDRVPHKVLLDRIVAIMKASDDDEIAITNPSISIDLQDPFSAMIWKTPVRGKDCRHRECFDLDTFFDTRPKIQQNGPHSANDWKCPICQKDARPSSLIVDGFLEDVRADLETKGKLNVARAILVKEDGEWEVKEDQTLQQQDRQSSSATAVTGDSRENGVQRATSTPIAAVDAIMLDDDDDGLGAALDLVSAA